MSEITNNQKIKDVFVRLAENNGRKLDSNLQAALARGAVGTAVGESSAGASRPTAGDAGIRSPLTETDGTRTLFPTVREIVSADGVLVLQYQEVSEINMLDSESAAVQIVLDEQA